MKNFKLKLCLAVLLLEVFYTAYAGSEPFPADISADLITYDRSAGTVYAEGNVEVYYREMEFSSDRVRYCMETSEAEAWGNIKFREKRYTLEASRMKYSLRTSTGIVFDAKIAAEPLYIAAESVHILGPAEFNITSGYVTTCDQEPAHYRLSGRKINVRLDSSISAWNTMLSIRGVPAFFYPYYFKNLAPRKLELSYDAGRSDSVGFYLKGKAAYPFTENSKTYAGVDVMTVKGAGFRLGHGCETVSGKSDAELYYIKEADTGHRQRRIFLSGWQGLSSELILNYRTEYTSYRQFGYDYDRDGFLYKQDNLYYQLSADLLRSRYHASLYLDRRDVWGDGRYSTERYLLPGAVFNLFPVSMPGRISFTADSGYVNSYDTVSDRWVSSLSWRGGFRGSYRFNPSRNYYASLTPGTGYDGIWRQDDFLRHYVSGELGIRQGFYNRVFLGNTYSWRRELESPYDTVGSMLSSDLTLMPLRGFMLSARTSYNFLSRVERPVGNIFTSAEYRRGGNRYYLMNRYDYHDKKTLDWLAEVYFAGFSETRLRYNYLYPERIELSQRFEIRKGNFFIVPGVRLHFEKSPNFYSFSDVIEKSLSVVWDMHCWQSRLRAVRRGSETEFWLLFNIKAFPDNRAGVYGNIRADDEGPFYGDYRFHRE